MSSTSARVDVLCLRHGISTWNLLGRWQGQADPPLSDVGREEAAAVAALVTAAVPTLPDRIWTSTLQRAAETARILAAGLSERSGTPIAVIEDGRLVEASVGPWEGLTTAEIEAGWPGLLSVDGRPDGFELAPVLLARVVPAVVDVARATVAAGLPAGILVSHAGVLRSLWRHGGGDDARIPNLGGIWLTVDTERATIEFSSVFDPLGAPNPPAAVAGDAEGARL